MPDTDPKHATSEDIEKLKRALAGPDDATAPPPDWHSAWEDAFGDMDYDPDNLKLFVVSKDDA